METSAKWTDLIPEVGLKIAEVFDQGDAQYVPGISNVIEVTTGEGAQQNYSGKTGFGELKKFAEGDNVPAGSRYKTYTTSVAYNNYGEHVQVTKNLIEDRDYASQLDEMKDLSKAANYSMDKSGMQLFNGAFATTTTVNGYTMTWYGDGVPLCSTVHPTTVPGGSTQSNASSTGIPLTHSNFETGRLALELQQTDNGLAIAMAGKQTVVVPLTLEKKVKETLDSELTPENSNNAINVFRGSTDVVVSKFLDTVNGGSNTRWFIISKGDAKLYHEVRQEKRLEQDVDILSKTVTFTVDARWADFAKDFRGIWGSPGDLAAYAS